jgi:quinol-cytochrome oxidoreductase complex cytochrome b subunit
MICLTLLVKVVILAGSQVPGMELFFCLKDSFGVSGFIFTFWIFIFFACIMFIIAGLEMGCLFHD